MGPDRFTISINLPNPLDEEDERVVRVVVEAAAERAFRRLSDLIFEPEVRVTADRRTVEWSTGRAGLMKESKDA